MAKDALWFSHDSNARNDPKIRALRHRYGAAGYGAWWIIVEMLRDAEDYRLPHKPYVIESIALECNMSSTDVERLLNDCSTTYELLESDGAFFWSASLARRMEPLDARREQAKEAGKKSAQRRKNGMPPTTAERPLNDRSTTVQLIKGIEESKGKETEDEKALSAPDGADAPTDHDSIGPADDAPTPSDEPPPPKYTDADMRRAERLRAKIDQIDPRYFAGKRKPNLPGWADTFRLIRTADGRTDEDIDMILDRLHEASFWKDQVRSAEALRGTTSTGQYRFDAILRDITSSRTNGTTNGTTYRGHANGSAGAGTPDPEYISVLRSIPDPERRRAKARELGVALEFIE